MCASLLRRIGRRLADDAGTSLTEAVIVIPLFAGLVLWSQFFVDMGIVKLKVREAARFAAWEIAGQREPRDVLADTEKRFKNLDPLRDNNRRVPLGVRSFNKIDWKVQTRTLPGINPAHGMPPVTGMGVDVVAETENTLFPTSNAPVLSMLFPARRRIPVSIKASVFPIQAHVWKAWPSRWDSVSGASMSTDPMETYPQQPFGKASPGELFMAKGAAAVGDKLCTVVQPFQLGAQLITPSFGQICASGTHVGDRATTAWVGHTPGSIPAARGKAIQRWGNKSYTNINMQKGGTSADPGIDRSRFSTPGHVNTPNWRNTGGFSNDGDRNRRTYDSDAQNPYVKAYKCRDAYYLGSSVSGKSRLAGARGWASSAFPRCP